MEKKLAYIDVDCYLTGDDEFSSALEEGLINDEITNVELSKAGYHIAAVIYAPFEKLRKFMIGNYFANEADFEEHFEYAGGYSK
jgi:hypothetical protein